MNFRTTLIVIFLLFVVAKTTATLSELHSPTGTFLKGPGNQSVHVGRNAQLKCRIHDYESQGGNSPAIHAKYLSVQWIIDEFGVSNETVKSVYDYRYHMPGPANEGIYDLIITNVQLEDEAVFVCQANVKLYRQSEPPAIETLTSTPAFLTVIVPPRMLTLTHLPPKKPREYAAKLDRPNHRVHADAKNRRQSSSRKLPGEPNLSDEIKTLSHIAADDPKIENLNSHSGELSENRIPSQHSIHKFISDRVLSDKGAAKGRTPTLWVKENDQLLVECRSTPSKPASKIKWFLNGAVLEEEHGSLSEYVPDYASTPVVPSSWNYTSHHLLWVKSIEKFKIQQIFESVKNDQRRDPATPKANNRVRSDTDIHAEPTLTQITISILKLVIQRRHRDNQLECRISNSDEFMMTNLPVVSAVIEPMYIEQINLSVISKNGKPELKEGMVVDLQCQAVTNPENPLYSWTIDSGDRLINKQYYNISQGSQENFLTGAALYDQLVIPSPADASLLNLKLRRSLHRSRVSCWVGVDVPNANYFVSNSTFQEHLTAKRGKCDSRCREASDALDSRVKQMAWKKAEMELNILYGPFFDQNFENLLGGKIGHIVEIKCIVDSNPVSHISLYRIGQYGQHVLDKYTYLQPLSNDSTGRKFFRPENHHLANSPQNELSSEALEEAVQAKGTKLLAAANRKILYPVRLNDLADFGFYACVARNAGFNPVSRHVLIEQSGPPRILQAKQSVNRVETVGELVCAVHSIPRPTADQLVWTRRGVVLHPNERYSIVQEKTMRGMKSTLLIHDLLPEDITEYNCTAYNEYGSDWKTIALTISEGLPLVFIFGSGVALFLASIFIAMICFLIRFTRRRSKRLVKQPENAAGSGEHEKQFQSDHTIQNLDAERSLEMQPMVSVSTDRSLLNSYDPLNPIYRYCQTMPRSSHPDFKQKLRDKRRVTLRVKRSIDSGFEATDGISLVTTHNDSVFSNQAMSVMADGEPLLDTKVVGHAMVSSPPPGHPYYSFVSNEMTGEMYRNIHLEPCSSQPLPLSINLCTTPTKECSVRATPASQSVSPITFMQHSNVYENPSNSQGLILPSVMLQQESQTVSPPQNNSPPQPPSSFMLTSTSTIFPDISVLPLNFCRQIDLLAEPKLTAQLSNSNGSTNHNQCIHSDDDGTTV